VPRGDRVRPRWTGSGFGTTSRAMSSLAAPSPPSDRAFYVANVIVSVAAVALLGWILVLRQPAGDASALSFMPAVNAIFNAAASACLVSGFFAIRNRKLELHKKLMFGALACSALFLVGYLVYHWVHGDTPYPTTSPYRGAYLAVLASHVVLSILVFPMILTTFWLSLTNQLARHRKLAKFTLPIWLYVSVTGVVVFLMLRLAGA
jgi:putative membrane protein